MEIIGLRPNKTGIGEFVVIATEAEINRIEGIDNVVPIAGRLKVGTQIHVSDKWDAMKTLAENTDGLKSMAASLRSKADEIENAIETRTKDEG